MERIQLRLVVVAITSLVLAACGPATNITTQDLASETENSAACDDFHEKVRGVVVDALLDQRELPELSALEAELRERLSQRSDLDEERAEAFITEFLNTYRTLTTETEKELGLQSPQELIAAITALEIGDRSDEARARLHDRLKVSFTKTKASAALAGLSCSPPKEADPVSEEPTETPEDPAEEPADPVDPVDPEPNPEDPVTDEPTPEEEDSTSFKSLALPVQGAVKVLATAYQSCQSARIPAMNRATADAQGISIVGTHPNGVGKIRKVTSLSSLQRTHYYIREGSDSGSSCFKVPSNPLIYDYGGKPYAKSSDTATLDLFKDSGSGGSVLGIDCSGYVFSALAVSGLRLAPGKKLKASLVYGVNARMMMNPESNGLSCMSHVKFTSSSQSLRNGDILASTGHVVMIDSVSADPFGVIRIQKSSDCVAANISHRNFDFDVLQSSPSKGSVGINRMRAADYLDESGSMREALVQYGIAACKARFGIATSSLPSAARLVRHKQTSECKDTAVKLERESCVASCPVFQ